MTNKTTLYVLAIALIVLAIGAGIYFSGILNPPVSTTPTVRIGYLTGDLHQLALQTAIAKGFFAQQGLNYTLKQYVNGPSLMQDFVKGELDFAYVGAPPATNARAKAINDSASHLPVVIASVNTIGSTLVVNQQTIINLTDLNGKKIGTPGVGTIQDVLLTMLKTQQNLTLTSIASTISQLPIIFSQGEIDGFIGWEPAPSIAQVNSNASVLLTSGSILEGHQCCVLVVSNKYLAAHADVAQKMYNVHKAATEYVNAHPDEVKQIAVNYTTQPATVIDLAFPRIGYTLAPNKSSMETFMSAMIDANIITNIQKDQVHDFINNMVDTRFLT